MTDSIDRAHINARPQFHVDILEDVQASQDELEAARVALLSACEKRYERQLKDLRYIYKDPLLPQLGDVKKIVVEVQQMANAKYAGFRLHVSVDVSLPSGLVRLPE